MKRFLACCIAAALMITSVPVAAAETAVSDETGTVDIHGSESVISHMSYAHIADYGIMTLRSYDYTAVHVPETSLSFSSSDGVSGTTIRSTLESLITSHEGSSTSINKNDNGTVSIGRLQFRGELALELMRLVVAADPDTAYDTLGASLYNEITNPSTSWAARPVNDEEAEAIANLLGKSASLEVQDNYVNSLLSMYLNQAYAEGFRKVTALLYYGDICNHYGMSVGTKMGKYAANVAGSAGAVTANEMHIACICYMYDNYGTDEERYAVERIPLQRTLYGNIVDIAESSGWDYCQSGDSVIPYNSDGSNGVRWIKKTLNASMNAGLTVNDSYDSATTEALKIFQANEGLTQTGVADEKTSSLLIYRVYDDKAQNGGDLGILGDLGGSESSEDYEEPEDSEGLTGIENIERIDGIWTYTVDGMPDYTYSGLAKNSHGWWYVEKGVVTFEYTGFAENSYGIWYVEDSKVTFEKNSVIKDSAGAIGNEGTWWYVVGSKVQTDFTGLADYKNSNGWWYIRNGVVDFDANTVAKNKNGWWYVTGGKVDFSYNGFAENDKGKWYCEDGKVTFEKNSVIKDKTGAIGTANTWYYVVESKVQTGFTGLADYKNSNGWWYIRNGVVDFTVETVAENKNGWWYVTGGKVDFSYNGFASNSKGKWYIENGNVTFEKNSVIKDKTGAVGTKNTWYYVVGSKVQTGFTGLADYKNSYGWWYIKSGVVDFTADTVAKNKNGWWYVADGKVDFSYTGLGENENGTWYIVDGKVDFSYTGELVVNGKNYDIENGKVVSGT